MSLIFTYCLNFPFLQESSCCFRVPHVSDTCTQSAGQGPRNPRRPALGLLGSDSHPWEEPGLPSTFSLFLLSYFTIPLSWGPPCCFGLPPHWVRHPHRFQARVPVTPEGPAQGLLGSHGHLCDDPGLVISLVRGFPRFHPRFVSRSLVAPHSVKKQFWRKAAWVRTSPGLSHERP